MSDHDLSALPEAFRQRYWRRISRQLADCEQRWRRTEHHLRVMLDTIVHPPGEGIPDEVVTSYVMLRAVAWYTGKRNFSHFVVTPATPADQARINEHVAQIPAIVESERIMMDALRSMTALREQ